VRFSRPFLLKFIGDGPWCHRCDLRLNIIHFAVFLAEFFPRSSQSIQVQRQCFSLQASVPAQFIDLDNKVRSCQLHDDVTTDKLSLAAEAWHFT
jgi:hypothetical protein